MNEARLTALFRAALKASLALPLVACGATAASPPAGDGGHTAKPDATATDGGCSEAVGCGIGGCSCGSTSACVGGEWVCSCAACPPPADSGNPCKPTLPECPSVVSIAASCFDGGVPTDASLSFSTCATLCGGAATCSRGPAFDGGPIALECAPECARLGRAFAGMQRTRIRARGRLSPVARFFAESAQLEASAVDAFRILAGELAAHRAPSALVRSARAAARDEVRHARITRTIAGRYGACPLPPRTASREVRPLEAVALENAIEGCVRETFAALVAHHQAATATDPEVRAAMASIAVDETRHAALGWEVAAWAETRLSASARARVRAARRDTVEKLRAEVAREVPSSLVEVAGLPDAASAARMLAVIEAALWT